MEPLTERERQVLVWLSRGKSAQDVAQILGITISTVMFHYRRVASRYGTSNRTHTIVEAIRRREIAPDAD
jgi:LuxR family transcriptional regulator, quorum-sensing system regulator BjaR1